MSIQLTIANATHLPYVEELVEMYRLSAEERKTGIALRKPEYLQKKMLNGDAIIALDGTLLIGFCYIETWSHHKYVANSGLIVKNAYRKQGLAKMIKVRAFQLARDKYPSAKVFGITTSLAVMKINSELGYKPVTFSELTQDTEFWDACKSCPNYDILERNERRMCLCTGMLAPSKEEAPHLDLSHLILQPNPVE
ncbi:MAG: GNAT family N-acetyltransferase [Saprospiraceae bacterium]|nr:GNAT family N-acetyltransferase [Saprospiraceae bacterium]MCB9319139.1 GNAT family N-acetyltransferase [Lewinellaceae bacterium]